MTLSRTTCFSQPPRCRPRRLKQALSDLFGSFCFFSKKKKSPSCLVSSPFPAFCPCVARRWGPHCWRPLLACRPVHGSCSSALLSFLYIYIYLFMNSFEGIMARSGVARSRVLAVSVFSFSNPMSRFGPRFSCWLEATMVVRLFPMRCWYPQFGFALWLFVGNG